LRDGRLLVSEFSNKTPRRLPQGLVGKIIWVAVGITVFGLAYLVGDYIAPFVAAVLSVLTASINVFINPPRLPLP
jgi:hypothetical protein